MPPLSARRAIDSLPASFPIALGVQGAARCTPYRGMRAPQLRRKSSKRAATAASTGARSVKTGGGALRRSTRVRMAGRHGAMRRNVRGGFLATDGAPTDLEQITDAGWEVLRAIALDAAVADTATVTAAVLRLIQSMGGGSPDSSLVADCDTDTEEEVAGRQLLASAMFAMVDLLFHENKCAALVRSMLLFIHAVREKVAEQEHALQTLVTTDLDRLAAGLFSYIASNGRSLTH
eukprot:2130219-Rhodomonas_salina.1